jgi:DUF2946 family protein
MDEVVLRALRKWPDVPAVYGWLSLDRRGNWSIKGERVANPALSGFIARNYACDAMGRWYFQNGPQRVFVALGYAPYVYRTFPLKDGGLGLNAHTGAPAHRPGAAWLDDRGAVLLETELGIGVVHDFDLPDIIASVCAASGEPLEDGAIERLLTHPPSADGVAAKLMLAGHALGLSHIRCAELPARFGFVLNPRPVPGEPEC